MSLSIARWVPEVESLAKEMNMPVADVLASVMVKGCALMRYAHLPARKLEEHLATDYAKREADRALLAVTNSR